MPAISHRENNFDFVRVVAAICVIFSHQYALSGLPEPSVFSGISFGLFGVILFFTISGFLVAKSWDADPHVVRFGVKRLLRIWPAFAVAITLTALVLGPVVSTLPVHDYYFDWRVKDYFNNLAFSLRDELPLAFVGNALPISINGSLWTIPLEVKLYAALGILGVAGLLRQRWIITLLTLAVVFMYAVVEPRGDRIVNGLLWSQEQRLLLEFGLFFFAGVVFHKFGIHVTRRRALSALALCWMAAGIAYAYNRPLLSLLLVVPVATLVIGTASTRYVRRAARFGDISYGLYLYAFPVQQTLIWLYKDRLSWSALLVLVLITTFGLAFASWHLVEKRALGLKPRPQLAKR